MKMADREKLVSAVSYEARVAFVAFCLERCLSEARRHERGRAQLGADSSLADGLSMLWARALDATKPDQERIAQIVAATRDYERRAKRIGTAYARDVTLVAAVIPLFKGVALLQQPDATDQIETVTLDGSASRRVATARYVAGAVEGPIAAVGRVYADQAAARAAELAVLDAALERLHAQRGAPTRAAFDGIADWPRGAVSTKYARGVAGSHDE